MREIRVRAFEVNKKIWHYFHIPQDIGETVTGMSHKLDYQHWTEFTGLLDKNGNTEVYECDIIDKDGNVIGNKYETADLLKVGTNLLIPEITGKTWKTAIEEGLDRGLKYA